MVIEKAEWYAILYASSATAMCRKTILTCLARLSWHNLFARAQHTAVSRTQECELLVRVRYVKMVKIHHIFQITSRNMCAFVSLLVYRSKACCYGICTKICLMKIFLAFQNWQEWQLLQLGSQNPRKLFLKFCLRFWKVHNVKKNILERR